MVFCAILYGRMKEPQYRLSQFKKAREKEKIIQRWIKGKKLSQIMRKSLFKLSRTQWWSLKKRYQREGFAALLDHRRGGKRRKATHEVIEFIKVQKESRPEINSRELNELLKHRFGQVLSRVWLTQIIRQLGQKFFRGRPRKEKIDYQKGIAVDHAGVYFLKGADSDMEGVKTITEIILKGLDEYLSKAETVPSWKVLHSSPQTIRKKVQSLLYLPMFGMERPYHLLKYHKRGLGILTGSGTRYSYNTLDKFLCEIDKLPIPKIMSEALAQCYIETLCIEIELEDGSYFYIDGHAKHVWSSKNIPRVFFTTLKRAERGLHQFFIHSSKGNPLILLTCPGDSRLPGIMFNLIDAFENAIGKRIMKAVIFDREGLSLKIFEEFDSRKKYFITLLRDNQYKGIESFDLKEDFKPLKVEKDKEGHIKKVLAWVAEASYELKDRKEKRKYAVRVALVKKQIEGREKLIPIITNLRKKEEQDIARIAKRYFDRWPNQENIFKDMMSAIKFDSNHGYKKREVENRVILRKKEEIEENLRGLTRNINVATREVEKVKKELQTLEEIYQSHKELLKKESRELYLSLSRINNVEKRQELLRNLKLTEEKLVKLSEEYPKHLSILEQKLRNKEQYLKGLISTRESRQRELATLNLEEVLYEIRTEKDYIMSNFKILLTNLSHYVKRQYFPQEYHSYTMESMMRAFYHQDGYVKVRKRRIDVTLHSYDEPDLQKTVEYGCTKFNASNLHTLDGQRIWMWVEGMETNNVKF